MGVYKVVGLEEVVGPAGRFQAFRVEGETYEPRDTARRWHFIHWYAPEVRMEVKSRAVEPDGGGMEQKLVEFRPAGVARPPALFQGLEAFLGVWEGHWKEMQLATRLTVEKLEGDVASITYWQCAYMFPGLRRPRQQRAEGKFLDDFLKGSAS